MARLTIPMLRMILISVFSKSTVVAYGSSWLFIRGSWIVSTALLRAKLATLLSHIHCLRWRSVHQHALWTKMVINYYRCKMWCGVNWSKGEYIAHGSDLRWNERLLISLFVVTNCGVSLHLWSMQPTQALRKLTLNHTHPSFVICSNSYPGICDRSPPLYASMTWKVIEGISSDISRNPTRIISSMKVSMTTNMTHTLGVYDLVISFNRRPVSRAATVIASYWALCLYILVLFMIHTPVKDCYWSKHSTSLISSRWSLPGHPAT